MAVPANFDERTFSIFRGECEKIIDTRKRLPDFVFKRLFAKYFAIEYAHVYGDEFGAFLSRMSNIFEDESVNYMVVDPDPVDWYYQRESHFGLVSLEASRLPERYVEVMQPVRGTSKILAGANVGVFWGSSLKWGIFCDRLSWETAVIAVPTNVDVPMVSRFRCMDASSLSDYIKSQYRVKDPSESIAANFTKRFLANYSI